MNIETKNNWKSLGTLAYHRRLSVYLNCCRAGMDDEQAVIHVEKLFTDLSTAPLDQIALTRDEAAARRLENGQ